LKTEHSIEALISEPIFRLAEDFIRFDDQSFSAQIKFLQLSPTSDFRYSDLSFVDFSNSDLRGFDFTGANLRGAIGRNVKWDDTTTIVEADIEESMFLYRSEKQRFFQNNPDAENSVRRLATDYWANTILRIGELLEDRKPPSASLQIAKAVFEESRDITVRTDILLQLGRVDTKANHKAFLYTILSQTPETPAILRPVINVLRYQFHDDLDAFNIMLRYSDHSDRQIELAAIAGVLSSVHFNGAIERVRELVLKSTNPIIRRGFVGRIARKEFRRCARLLEDDSIRNFVDFKQQITESALRAMSRRSALKVLRPDLDDAWRKWGSKGVVPKVHEEHTTAELIQRLLFWIEDKYNVPFDFYRGPIKPVTSR